MKLLEAKKEEKQTYTNEVECYRECDPEVIEQIKQQTNTAKDAINRWTGENYFLSRILYVRNYETYEMLISKHQAVKKIIILHLMLLFLMSKSHHKNNKWLHKEHLSCQLLFR